MYSLECAFALYIYIYRFRRLRTTSLSHWKRLFKVVQIEVIFPTRNTCACVPCWEHLGDRTDWLILKGEAFCFSLERYVNLVGRKPTAAIPFSYSMKLKTMPYHQNRLQTPRRLPASSAPTYHQRRIWAS